MDAISLAELGISEPAPVKRRKTSLLPRDVILYSFSKGQATLKAVVRLLDARPVADERHTAKVETQKALLGLTSNETLVAWGVENIRIFDEVIAVGSEASRTWKHAVTLKNCSAVAALVKKYRLGSSALAFRLPVELAEYVCKTNVEWFSHSLGL